MMDEYAKLEVSLFKIRSFLTESPEEGMSVNQRVFGYVACVSAIYSALESFAEDIAFRFAKLAIGPGRLIGEVSEAKLQARYSANVAHLLGQQLGVGRYEKVSQLDLARSLVSLLDGAGEPTLRHEAIAHHAANLRLPNLVELFQWGTSDLSVRLSRSDAMRRWGSSVGRESGLESLVRSELDDLVDRRNSVAHRSLPDEIVAHSELLAKVEFVDALCLSLLACLGTQLLDRQATMNSRNVGAITEAFQSGQVVVIGETHAPLAVGDPVLARSEMSSRWGRILELRLQDTEVGSSASGLEVGIKLDFRSRDNAELFVVAEAPGELLSTPAGLFGDFGPLR